MTWLVFHLEIHSMVYSLNATDMEFTITLLFVILCYGNKTTFGGKVAENDKVKIFARDK